VTESECIFFWVEEDTMIPTLGGRDPGRGNMDGLSEP